MSYKGGLCFRPTLLCEDKDKSRTKLLNRLPKGMRDRRPTLALIRKGCIRINWRTKLQNGKRMYFWDLKV